jgi:hypothetical protein
MLPPAILQSFSSKLLSSPCPKFCDDCEVLWEVYQYILKKMIPKARNNPVWMAKLEKLKTKFLGIYERAKIKEDELKEKTKGRFPEPLTYFREINRHKPRLFGTIRARRHRV